MIIGNVYGVYCPVNISTGHIEFSRLRKTESAVSYTHLFMGLMVIAGLKSRALGDIVAIDLDEKRLEMAVQYGATKTLSLIHI